MVFTTLNLTIINNYEHPYDSSESGRNNMGVYANNVNLYLNSNITKSDAYVSENSKLSWKIDTSYKNNANTLEKVTVLLKLGHR